MALFHQGLNLVLREHLTLFQFYTLNELMSTTIEQEDTYCARMEEERKKRPLSGPTRALRPSTTWSTHPQASHVVPLCLSSGVTVQLSR
jgi:hypothetical protein